MVIKNDIKKVINVLSHTPFLLKEKGIDVLSRGLEVTNVLSRVTESHKCINPAPLYIKRKGINVLIHYIKQNRK